MLGNPYRCFTNGGYNGALSSDYPADHPTGWSDYSVR